MSSGGVQVDQARDGHKTQGGTASVGLVIDQLGRERRSTMLALGLDPKPFVEVFYLYGATSKEAVESGSCYVALRDSERNKEIKAPPNLQFRFLTEDVPFGLVPYRHLATLAGVETPVISALILLASVVNGVDLAVQGPCPGEDGPERRHQVHPARVSRGRASLTQGPEPGRVLLLEGREGEQLLARSARCPPPAQRT